LDTCQTIAQCATGSFCDAPDRACCPALMAGGTVYADSINGAAGAACCGIGGNPPCQTIARTMRLIDAATTPDVIIRASVGGGGGNWAPSDEVYPIVLGWGIELSAPGVYFTDQGSLGVINVTAFSAEDHVGYASITGSAVNPIWIGMDEDGDQSTDKSAIAVEAGSTLYIANATVNGNGARASCEDPWFQDGFGSTAIRVEGDAALLLGQDHSAAVTGTVHIGGDGLLDGCFGILCIPGNGTDAGCTVADADLGGISSVVIQGQDLCDIYVGRGFSLVSNISLTSKPVLGVPPSQVGFGQCKTKRDKGTAVSLSAPTHMTFDNGTVQCISGSGFYLASNGPPSAGDSLTLNINNTTIQNTDVGIDASDGIATVTSSTIQFNHIGVYDDIEGLGAIIDLSGAGADGGRNTVVCSGIVEAASPGYGLDYSPGIGVLNMTSTVINASNADWDTTGPDLFMCTTNDVNVPGTPCTCEIGNCTDSPGADGMDAVTTSTGTITTTGNGLSPIVCWPPDGG